MQSLWLVALAGCALGIVGSALLITPQRLQPMLMFALAMMATGAWLDSQASSLTRPEQMYFSQFLLAFSGTFFLGPVFVSGFGAVIAQPSNLISFSLMFSMTQNLGSLLGSALVGTFQVVREKFHSSQLVEHLTLQNPYVAARLQAQGLPSLNAAATREANILAYNDVFLMIFYVACATLAWMALHYAWQVCTRRRQAAPAQNAQTGMAQVSLSNSGAQ
jgi:hypothetical protein